MTLKIVIIGGTGVYGPEILTNANDIEVTTPYGRARGKVGFFEGSEVMFLTRHGADHSIPPHKINFRANIAGLKSLGVTHVIATGAVGSLNASMHPGDFVIIDQFLDFTKSRQSTFFDGDNNGVVHVDCTEPYCSLVRNTLLKAAESLGLTAHPKGCYVCTEGPRFETPAEIRMYRMLGGDVVGMTGVPEVVLAREAGLCYGTLAIVTNFAAGISENPLTHEEVLQKMKQQEQDTKALISRALGLLLDPQQDKRCNCLPAAQPIKV